MIKSPSHQMAYPKILEKYSNFGHNIRNSFRKKKCFLTSRQMGPNHPPNHIKWIGIELGGGHLIELGYPVEEGPKRP